MSEREILCACGHEADFHWGEHLGGGCAHGRRMIGVDECECRQSEGGVFRAEIARLDARVTELQEANTREVERRRAAELVMLASGFTFDWGEEER